MHGGMEVPTGQLFRLSTNNNVNGLSDIKIHLSSLRLSDRTWKSNLSLWVSITSQSSTPGRPVSKRYWTCQALSEYFAVKDRNHFWFFYKSSAWIQKETGFLLKENSRTDSNGGAGLFLFCLSSSCFFFFFCNPHSVSPPFPFSTLSDWLKPDWQLLQWLWSLY